MKQEDKELLLKDLCARLPYEVKLKITLDLSYDKCYDTVEQSCSFNATLYDINIDGEPTDILIHHDNEDTAEFLNEHFQECPSILEDWIPYLRPMSSMTEEEKEEFENLLEGIVDGIERWDKPDLCEEYDWLNAHHFDYRNLIERGLALEAPEGMYN